MGDRAGMNQLAGAWAALALALPTAWMAGGGPLPGRALPLLGAAGLVAGLGGLAGWAVRALAARRASGQQAAGPLPAAALLEALPGPVLGLDAEGRVTHLNPAWEALSGRPLAEVLGRPWRELLHPEDRPAFEAAFAARLRGERPGAAVELRCLTADGRALSLAWRAQPVRAADGRVSGLAGTLEELSTRKRLDARLQSHRGYVDTLLANVPGVVYRARNDRHYTMEFISAGCLELTGYEPHELIENRRLAFGDLIHPEDREFVWTHIQAHLARREVYQLAYRITEAGGRIGWVWEQGRGVFSARGELLAIEGFITDVSERRGAEEKARRRLWFEARTGLVSRPIFDSLLSWNLQQQDSGRADPVILLVLELAGHADCVAARGHEAAEAWLTERARRLVAALGPGAVACRLAGAQFAVLAQVVGGLGPADLPASGTMQAGWGAAWERAAEAQVRPWLARLDRPGDAPQESSAAAAGLVLGAPQHPGPELLLAAAQAACARALARGPGMLEVLTLADAAGLRA